MSVVIVRGLPRSEQGFLGEPPGAAVDAGGHAEAGVGWAGLMGQEV